MIQYAKSELLGFEEIAEVILKQVERWPVASSFYSTLLLALFLSSLSR